MIIKMLLKWLCDNELDAPLRPIDLELNMSDSIIVRVCAPELEDIDRIENKMIAFMAIFGESSFIVANALYKAKAEYLGVEEDGNLCRLYYAIDNKRYMLTLVKGQVLYGLKYDLMHKGVLQ